jgi:hypothetical protein
MEYPGLTDPQMSWQAVSVLMIAEIVSNGMLSLPQALAVVSYAAPCPIILVASRRFFFVEDGVAMGLESDRILRI